MNRFETWFIKRVLRREVIQSPSHSQNIRNIYGMVREACESEFTEDNDVTLNAFLEEQFKATEK